MKEKNIKKEKENTKEENKEKKILTLADRIEIEHEYRNNVSITKIAEKINKDRSTVYREINGKPREGRNRYRAHIAHKEALERISNRGNIRKIDKNKKLEEYIIEKLKLNWSPEQIAGRIKIDFKNDKNMWISYESIYEYIYDKNNIKENDLRIYLTRKHKKRAKKGSRSVQKAMNRSYLPKIEDRPKEVESRERIGDWEDDFIVSKKSNIAIKSVNERRSGIVFFGRTEGRKAVDGDKVLFNKLKQIPNEYLKTLTRDNGSENKDYLNVEKELNINVYFANPYHSWERGSNENANGLFRRYFKKGTDFAKIKDEDIKKVEYLINTRPRKRLNYLTPAEFFEKETGVALFSWM